MVKPAKNLTTLLHASWVPCVRTGLQGAEAPANTDHRLVVADVAVYFRPTQKQQPALKLDAQQLYDNKELGARYNLEIKIVLKHLETCLTTWRHHGNRSPLLS